MSSCQAHCCGADQVFDLKTAEKELRRYKKRGSSRVTRRMENFLNRESWQGRTLLDVGGGIGALQWNALQQGAITTTDVDASSGYQKIAQDYAEEMGWADQVEFVFGNFLDQKEKLTSYDVVTLDKVVCCYPEMEELLDLACSRSQKRLALSFPMDGIIAQAFRALGAFYMKYIEKNDFRPYVHPVKEIHETIENHGFRLVDKSLAFPWHVRLYERRIS